MLGPNHAGSFILNKETSSSDQTSYKPLQNHLSVYQQPSAVGTSGCHRLINVTQKCRPLDARWTKTIPLQMCAFNRQIYCCTSEAIFWCDGNGRDDDGTNDNDNDGISYPIFSPLPWTLILITNSNLSTPWSRRRRPSGCCVMCTDWGSRGAEHRDGKQLRKRNLFINVMM